MDSCLPPLAAALPSVTSVKSRDAGPGILNPGRVLTLAAGSADARAPDRNVWRLSSTSGAALALWLCQVSAVPQFQGRPGQKRYSASCHGFVESDELAWDLSRDPYKCTPVLGMVTGLARGPPIPVCMRSAFPCKEKPVPSHAVQYTYIAA